MDSYRPSSSALTRFGCTRKKLVRAMRLVVSNLPCGHRSRSSTSTAPLPSMTRRLAHGSGTHAPSILPCLNAVSVCALSCGRMLTSPPPAVSVLKPWFWRNHRRATSCVPPSCGSAIFLPFSAAMELMPGLTTSCAPPEVEPAMTRIAWPCDCANALVVGFGPTKVTSIELERMAVTASPPALNAWVSSVTSGPSAVANRPFLSPTSAGA